MEEVGSSEMDRYWRHLLRVLIWDALMAVTGI